MTIDRDSLTYVHRLDHVAREEDASLSTQPWELESQIDHGNLAGISDDDHTQYALLAGRSGGQTLIGGTAAANGLTFQTTAGIGVGSDIFTWKLGNNGAATVSTLASASGVSELLISSTVAAGSASISFANTGATAWTLGTDAAGNQNLTLNDGGTVILTINDGTGTPVTGNAKLYYNPTLTTSTANQSVFRISSTHSGTGDPAQAIAQAPIFAPSASISTAYGILAFPSFQPGSGVTITSAISAFYRVDTASTAGAVSTGFALYCSAPSFGSLKPSSMYGLYVANQGATGVTNAVGVAVELPTNASNNWVFSLPADATDPTGGGGAATGRIPCLIGGTTRYIAYY